MENLFKEKSKSFKEIQAIHENDADILLNIFTSEYKKLTNMEDPLLAFNEEELKTHKEELNSFIEESEKDLAKVIHDYKKKVEILNMKTKSMIAEQYNLSNDYMKQ